MQVEELDKNKDSLTGRYMSGKEMIVAPEKPRVYTSKAKNAQLTQDIVKDFGRNACGACHTPFRVPPPRTS